MSYAVAMFSVHTSPLDLPGRTKDAGGMNVYMRELAQALAERNVCIDIFTRWTNEQTPQVIQLNSKIRVVHVKAGPLAPVRKHDLYRYLPAFVRSVEAFRKRETRSYDLVHSHYWLSGVVASQLARQWDVPHIIMFHTLARLKQLANPAEAEPPLRLVMEQKLIQQADRIIAATADERLQMIRHYGATPHRVAVIPCGVDLQRFVPQAKQQARAHLGLSLQQPLLLFAGRLDPFKGPDVLLRAASMMEEPAQVLIVGGKPGEDEERLKLQQLAEQLDIRQRVHFLDARPQQELPLIYSAADVTVVPSYHEIFGLVAAESLACGTPVVATRAGGLATIVRHGETGFLVPRCPGFFAEKLDALLRDEELYASMQAACRASVLHFSWQNVAASVHSLYDELICDASCMAAR
ncbi:MAG: glycosyltransferase [Ktedonobacteraceae bacterium]|nr:glycosyltransferase [Ktedonobacteraceae bacterium]